MPSKPSPAAPPTVSQKSSSIRSRKSGLFLPLLFAFTIMGGLLRAYQIGSKGLWLDEAFSVWMSRQPIPEMLSWLVRIDQHPPLYYLVLHFWMRLGDDATTVRALSALIGTLTIPAIYSLGQRLAGRGVGLLAAIILALSPFHVRFAQEARMYTLLSLCASLALSALARLLADPRAATKPLGGQLMDLVFPPRSPCSRRLRGDSQSHIQMTETETVGQVSIPAIRRLWKAALRSRNNIRAIETDLAWIAYMLFTAATMWTHNTALFYLGAVNLYVFGLIWFRRRKPGGQGQLSAPSLRNWIVAQLGVLLLWSPWLRAFAVQATGIYREFWLPAPTWKTVLETIQNLLNAFLPQRIEWEGVIWSLYGTIALLGAVRLRKRPARPALLCTLFIVPFAGELLVSLRRPIFYDRTLIWASIPLYLLLALGIRQLGYRSYILTAVAILATVNALSIREYFLRFEKEQWDDAARYVAQRVEDGDLILFHATWVQLPFDFYFDDANRSVEKCGVPVDLFDRGVLEPKMTVDDLPRLRALLRGRERVWLIYSHHWYTDPQNLIPTALEETLHLLKRRRFYGLEVRLYGAESTK